MCFTFSVDNVVLLQCRITFLSCVLADAGGSGGLKKGGMIIAKMQMRSVSNMHAPAPSRAPGSLQKKKKKKKMLHVQFFSRQLLHSYLVLSAFPLITPSCFTAWSVKLRPAGKVGIICFSFWCMPFMMA